VWNIEFSAALVWWCGWRGILCYRNFHIDVKRRHL